MVASLTEMLEELKEVFTPTVAKAEEDVEDVEEEDDEDEDDDEDDDDEDEDAVTDQYDTLRAECQESEEGKHALHHYMECAERVTKAQEDPNYHDAEYKEDCVEEFFHLHHIINECAAPKLFNHLK